MFESSLPEMLASQSDFDESHSAPLEEDGSFQAALLPLRDNVIFPRMVHPLFVARTRSVEALRVARERNETLIGALQVDPGIEDPTPTDIHRIGVELALGRSLRMPDGSTSMLVKGRRRVEIVEYTLTEPYYRVRVRPMEEDTGSGAEVEARRRVVLALFERITQMNRVMPEEAYIFALNADTPGFLADTVAYALDLTLTERQSLLETANPVDRLNQISMLLGQELNLLQLEEDIHNRIMQQVDQSQNEMFLREQIRAIQSELGEGDIFEQERQELETRIKSSDMPPAVMKSALREVERLAAIPSITPEVGIIRTYLDVLLDLPWAAQTQDNLDIGGAETTLEADHYGLQKAKERILEHIAVRQLAAEKMKTPILCFVGPPGTGKTSLGRSIARALGREFVRMSLGGVTDESEIRGHRRTYIGAMPGRIVQGMRRAGTINPLFMLDEIDKLGSDFRGDPSAALLEVLDPEQNHAFSDNYLDVDYDLSKVLFITTANTSMPIPPALQDRLEFIEFPGYIEEEKLQIARKFLIPKILTSHGLTDYGLAFEEEALRTIIRDYTYEAGVRNLEREIANVVRKVARLVAEGKKSPKRITPKAVSRMLGPSQAPRPILISEGEVGIAQGVAWTDVGGEVFPVEVSVMPGKGNLTLTGQLGDIMQESAQAAFSYLRARADDFEIDHDQFEETDVHIHLPENAIPKDGPSAGITLATALISAFTERPVRHDLVMTGEITLRGRVLPVGGLKEKVLAAHRLGVIRTVIIPEENEKDLREIPAKAKRDLNIVTVSTMDDVLDAALQKDLPQ